MTIASVVESDINAIQRGNHSNPDLAVLGDETGAVFVNGNPGYVWVRPLQAGGTFGKATRARGPLQAMPMEPGHPVKLGVIEGQPAVLESDFAGLLSKGINPSQSAADDPNANKAMFVKQSYITTAYGQIVEGTLFIAIRGWLILASGVWSKLDKNIGPLTVPGAGDHCLAVIAVQSDGVTLEVQYSTDKSVLIALDLDDLNEAWSAMADPTTNAPLWAFELADGQTAIVEDNRWADLRQMINFVMSGGGAGTVTSVGLSTDASYLEVGSTPVTNAGTITLNKKDALTANQVVATPNGTPGKADLRALVAADIPVLSYAPVNATYITQTHDATLTNEQAMGDLATGIVKNATTTGVQSIAAAGTDYTSPTGTENLSNKTITASTLIATALSLLIGGFKAIFSHANSADRTYTFPDASGNVIIDTATQNLSNKTITSSSLNSTPIGASSASSAIVTALSILIGGFKAIFTHANSADRTYTYPDASGNVLIDTATQNASNKTITSSSLNSTPIGASSASTAIFSALSVLIGGFKAIFTHAFTADRTVTLPGDANVTLVGTDTTQTLTNKSIAASEINSGTLALANGGTNADLSASGSATAVLAQDASHVVSARALIAADIPNLAASKITSGQLATARGGTGVDLSASGSATAFLAEDASQIISARSIISADIATALTTPGPIGSTTPGNVTALELIMKTATILTVSSHTVVVTQSFHYVSSSGFGADTLNTATGGTNGQILVLRLSGGANITIINAAGGTGQFALMGGVDAVLSNPNSYLCFVYDGTNWVQIGATNTPAQLAQNIMFCGNGADGNLTINSGITTLTRDMYYNNITITGTAQINTNGYRLFWNGILDISGAPTDCIFSDGQTGGNATTFTGGTAAAALSDQTVGGAVAGPNGANGRNATSGAGTQGTVGNVTTPGNGGAGGASGKGGQSSGGVGGGSNSGGTPTLANPMLRWCVDTLRGIQIIRGGSSGAGGGSGGSAGGVSGGGGAGGGGGGVVWLSGNIINRSSSGAASIISALGGIGGNGANSNGAGTGDGGGGGGGGGGWIYIAFLELTGTLKTNLIDASGGAGGNAGTVGTTSTIAAGGTGGSGGRITIVNLGAGTVSETTGSTGTGPTGRTGGAGNAFKVDL